MTRRLVVWHPFPIITRAGFKWLNQQFERILELGSADKDTLNMHFTDSGFDYECSIPEFSESSFDYIIKEQERRMRAVNAIATNLFVKNFPDIESVEVYPGNDDTIDLQDLGVNDILVLSSHGCTRYASLASQHILLGMRALANGLVRHGLDANNTPHIYILACQAGSICSSNIKGFKKYPFILTLRDKLVELNQNFKSVRITGTACTFDRTTLNAVVKTDSVHDKAVKLDMATLSGGYWRFLTIEDKWVWFTNHIKHTTPRSHNNKQMTLASIKNEIPPRSDFEDPSEDITYDDRYVGGYMLDPYRHITSGRKKTAATPAVRKQCAKILNNGAQCRRISQVGRIYCHQH